MYPVRVGGQGGSPVLGGREWETVRPVSGTFESGGGV